MIMSRKSYLEQACEAVPGFRTISEQFLRKYTIAGKSESCTRNYLMQISKMVLRITSYNVCYTKLLRTRCRCP